MLNVGIVGCGKIAEGHISEIRKLDNARLVSVCDLEPILAHEVAVRYSIPRWYTDFDDMLSRERLDIVHIATPPQSHLALARKSALAGCHLFLEKPLAMNAQESRQLIECAQQAGRKLTINYWNNFETPALTLKQFISRGRLGDPVHIESYYGYDLTSAFGQALQSDDHHWIHQLPGKLLNNVIDHGINKVIGFFPDEAPEIVARAYHGSDGEPAAGLFEELRVMMLGTRVSAYVTFCSHARPVGHFLRVYGTKNTVHVDFRLRTMLIEAEQTVPGAFGRLLPPFQTSWQAVRQATRNAGDFAKCQSHYFAGMNRLLSLFYQSVINDTPEPIAAGEILRVSETMDQIFAQVYPGVLV